MMMSSETSAPESITAFTFSPSSLPAFTADRNMSPVEIWGIPNSRQMNCACVPFPAPGGPSSMILMSASSDDLLRDELMEE